jgi:hypothetical protein
MRRHSGAVPDLRRMARERSVQNCVRLPMRAGTSVPSVDRATTAHFFAQLILDKSRASSNRARFFFLPYPCEVS